MFILELQYDGRDFIDEFEFANDTVIEKVILPREIKHIKKFAFFMCSNLKEIVLPNSLETIGENAFSKCYNLK